MIPYSPGGIDKKRASTFSIYGFATEGQERKPAAYTVCYAMDCANIIKVEEQ